MLPDRAEALSQLLQPDKSANRNEPEIPANIAVQMDHMGLIPWSLSVMRRIRDIIVHLKPKNIIEINAGIGHKTAWIHEGLEGDFDNLEIVEEGNRFAVIIQRVIERYSTREKSRIITKPAHEILAEAKAWKAANTGSVVMEAPLALPADLIIIDGSDRANLVKVALPLLSRSGILLTIEPDVPEGDRQEGDSEVEFFNEWIQMIHEIQSGYHVAFTPLYEGTLVAFMIR